MARADRPRDAHDPTRREFFRTFGRETVRQAGAVAGAAAELRRSGMDAARVLLDPRAVPAEVEGQPSDQATAESTFRSAYRFTGDALVVLDARELPGRVETVSLIEPSEVASAMRVGAINGGPVLAEVGAYAMVLAARTAANRPGVGRHQQLRAAAGTLRGARREVRALAWAIDRLEARYDELANSGAGADAQPVAEALRAEADAIASQAADAHAAIGRLGAARIPPSTEGPVNLLVHGDMGPLSCGLVGLGTALIGQLRDAGRDVHVWLTEASPSGEGGRIAAAQLRQLEVPHTVVPDAAVAWLLAHHRVDALLLRGDRVCANGDCGVLLGGLGAAQLAATAGVPVHVLAPLASLDLAALDGAAIDAVVPFASGPIRLSPTADVVPAELITSFLTEAGAFSAPYTRSLAGAV